jgi:hypothetical protein
MGEANVSVATCPPRPEIRATVVISSCAAVTFAPNNSSSERETYSGTVMGAVVRSAHIASDSVRQRDMDGLGGWRKGASETLFIPRPVDGVCPARLPAELVVQTSRACCDMLPFRGPCLLPVSIFPVTIISTDR